MCGNKRTHGKRLNGFPKTPYYAAKRSVIYQLQMYNLHLEDVDKEIGEDIRTSTARTASSEN